MLYLSLVSTVIACAALGAAQAPFPKYPRQAPADPSDVTVITSPNGAKLKYSRPGEQGVCETSPGVDSYSGYISLNESYNMFFYFFEARNNVETAPITLVSLLVERRRRSIGGIVSDLPSGSMAGREAIP